MRESKFAELGAALASRSKELLAQWFPRGIVVGGEFKVGSLSGEPGRSLSICLKTGKWADFAVDGRRGGDLISLYAAANNLTNSEAYDALKGAGGVTVPDLHPKEDDEDICAPPPEAAAPSLSSVHWGPAIAAWVYNSTDGGRMFYISRHEHDGKKQFLPWTWSKKRRAWANRAWPGARPLYGLDILDAYPKTPVVVVEGEKCADALRSIGCPHVVVTWPGGASALTKVDLTPLNGRHLILWPDADKPGRDCMERLAESMADRAGDIKIVDTNGMPEKWDVADAVAEGWEWDDVHAWAKSRVKRWDPKNAAEKAKTKQEKRDAEIVDRAKLWESLGLTIGPSMQPACNIDNIAKILEGWEVVQDSVWMCGFTGKVLTNFNTPESPKPREWSDVDDLSLTRLIQSRLDMPKVSVQVVHDAVHLVASQKVVNPLEEFLLKAERSWDGTYRLCSWLSTVFGCDQNTYTSAVGRCWLVSMVARAFRPGCKVDTMPILEGGQGVGKSTALSILGGEFFAECHESITSKDFFGVLHGKWLVEISEMHAFNKGEKERIKGIISCATDRYRVPYGRNTMDHPRRCVFAGTTNRTDWNHDETGARRFWPVECGEIDLEWLRQHRSLLLGEAMVRWRAGEPWWDIPKLEQVDLVERRRIRDTWEETLHERLEPMRRYSTADILEHLLGVEIGRQERRMVLRVREIMILLGWKEVFSKTLDRKTIRSWIKE